ncbi:hypothetical protein TNIN_454741 [Trichonephila inaurata madagascariensis]|uniref:Uncharacterized protein n=1 Tax=Trichonephila inaurata madagascariensis TaxID=2747483 RepID=A0A8X6J354_9ARAC|nr:hypothetical protein TNIN_454741 [Trichonephila inaurata madagascariensis]
MCLRLPTSSKLEGSMLCFGPHVSIETKTASFNLTPCNATPLRQRTTGSLPESRLESTVLSLLRTWSSAENNISAGTPVSLLRYKKFAKENNMGCL